MTLHLRKLILHTPMVKRLNFRLAFQVSNVFRFRTLVTIDFMSHATEYRM